MNINQLNLNSNKCLTLACVSNPNVEVIKYLIEGHLMNIENIGWMRFGKFRNIVLEISKKYRDLNNLLLMGWTKYPSICMKRLIDLINPLQLNDGIRNLAGVENPYNSKFKIFAQCVDELMWYHEPIFVD